MFGNNLGGMFGNIQEQQKELQEKLSSITVDAEVENGAIKVTASANKEIVNISIDSTKIDLNDKEQLEDLLLTATNRALQLAAEEGAKETQKLLNDMVPGGLGSLGGLFGK